MGVAEVEACMRHWPRGWTHFAALLIIGLLLILYANERDARRQAEAQAVQLADVVNDMIRFQIEQVRTKAYRMEIVP